MRYWFDEERCRAFALEVPPPDGKGIMEITEEDYREIVASVATHTDLAVANRSVMEDVAKSQEVERLSAGLSVMGDEIDRLIEAWVGGSDDASPDPPKTPIRRSRGRPRTKRPPRFEVPSHIVELIRRRGRAGNIPEKSEEDRRECEEDRRERVSEAVRAAYREGRNTANANRKKEANQRKVKIIKGNKDIIADQSLSISAAAALIISQGRNHDLGDRTLRDAIGRIRKFVWIGKVARKGKAGKAK